MGFKFLGLVYLHGEFPNAVAAQLEAERIYGKALKRVVSDASDEVARDEESGRARSRRLRFLPSDEEV